MEIFGWNTNKLTNKLQALKSLGSPKHTRRDWTIAAGFFLLIALVLGGFSLWSFYKIQSGTFKAFTTDEDPTQAIQTINRDELNEIVSEYNRQQATFELIRERQPDIPNPAQ